MAVAKATRKKSLPDFDEYIPLEKESLVKKVAHFLDWCAKNRPKEIIPYNQIAFRVLGLKHMPRMQNSEVLLVQNSVSRARPILLDKYDRGLVAAPGIGVRATVDDIDMVMNPLAQSVRRLERDSARAAQLFNKVDPTKIPDTEENIPWKEWYIRQAGGDGLFKRITSKDWERKLALPSIPEEKK